MAETIGQLFPPLATYCPILPSLSVPQGVFLTLPREYEEAFYGGAVGGGKTGALLMAALQYVDIPGYAALLLRRTYGELEQPEGLVPQSLRWFSAVPEADRPTYNRSDHEWTFPSSARIVFGHLDNPNAMIRYQGGGYHFVGFDELTHFDEHSYEFIAFSRQRRPPRGPLSQVPMRIRSTANPGGPGHIWVKRRFITHRKDDVAFVPAKMWDNPGIDQDDYAARLGKMDEVLRRQLLDGDWGAFEGAAFSLDETAHLVPSFTIPTHWHRFESMDHGVSAPTAWLLWANDTQGNHVVCDEYYEIRDTVAKHAAEIKTLREAGWQRKDEKGWPLTNAVYADPSIVAKSGIARKLGDPASVMTEYNDCGLALALANNDRKAGFARLRELIDPNPERPFPDWHPRYGQRGAPKLYICAQRCPHLVEQIKGAPLQPIDKKDGGEIVDPDWETQHGHALAALRYGAMGRLGPSAEPEVIPEDPRAQRMLELRKRLDVTDDYEDPADQFLAPV